MSHSSLPERNMTISRLWVNYQCAELYPGLQTSPQCNVPTTPLVIEPGLRAHSESRASALTNSAKGVRPIGEKLAGRLDCHKVNTGSDNYLLPHRQQVIAWNNDCVYSWCMFPSRGFIALTVVWIDATSTYRLLRSNCLLMNKWGYIVDLLNVKYNGRRQIFSVAKSYSHPNIAMIIGAYHIPSRYIWNTQNKMVLISRGVNYL